MAFDTIFQPLKFKNLTVKKEGVERLLNRAVRERLLAALSSELDVVTELVLRVMGDRVAH